MGIPRVLPAFEDCPPLAVPPYIRTAQYYETDQMKIIHHAVYVHWMEEARVEVMERLGFGYERMEAMGIYCPVLAVSTEYRAMVRFRERVSIECRIAAYNGIKLILAYRMTKADTGEECVLAQSRHGFLDDTGRILSLKKAVPEVHALLLSAAGGC